MSELVKKAISENKILHISVPDSWEAYASHPADITVDSDTQMFILNKAIKRTVAIDGSFNPTEYGIKISNLAIPCRKCTVRLLTRMPKWALRTCEEAQLRNRRIDKVCRYKLSLFRNLKKWWQNRNKDLIK